MRAAGATCLWFIFMLVRRVAGIRGLWEHSRLGERRSRSRRKRLEYWMQGSAAHELGREEVAPQTFARLGIPEGPFHHHSRGIVALSPLADAPQGALLSLLVAQ